MNIQDICDRIENIVQGYKIATKDTFESESKNGKKLYRSILNLFDELQSCRPSDELFDEDELSGDFDNNFVSNEEIKEEKNKSKISVEDLLEDDIDEIW
jgi:hypothetical protein